MDSAVAFAHTDGKHDVEEQRLAGLGVGLHEERANRDVIYDAAQALFKGSAAANSIMKVCLQEP
jgi:hypothetical protein